MADKPPRVSADYGPRRAEAEKLRRSSADDLRAAGWSAAYDYRQDGIRHWLVAKGDTVLKGEGRTDAIALDMIRRRVAELGPGERDGHETRPR